MGIYNNENLTIANICQNRVKFSQWLLEFHKSGEVRPNLVTLDASGGNVVNLVTLVASFVNRYQFFKSWMTNDKKCFQNICPSLTQWPTLFRQTAGNGLWPFFNRGHRKLFTWTWTDLFNILSSHFFCPYLNWVFYLHYTKYSTLKKGCFKFVNNFLYPELILWWKFQGKTLIF